MEGNFIGYKYYEKKAIQVAFPFGYGLSYADFKYDNFTLENTAVKVIPLNVIIAEIGGCTGICEKGTLPTHNAHDVGKACLLAFTDLDSRCVYGVLFKEGNDKFSLGIITNLSDCKHVYIGSEFFYINGIVGNKTTA